MFQALQGKAPFTVFRLTGRLAVPLTALLYALVAVLASTHVAADGSTGSDTFQLFLVRHAEKEATGEDPQLSETGVRRAEALAHILKDAGVQAVWSSDYRRTRQTAMPLAEAEGIELRLYDPHQLGPFARQLINAGETALVVGHSNTTPKLAQSLGGEALGEIDEKSEYDRLYVLTITGTHVVNTTLLRYSAK